MVTAPAFLGLAEQSQAAAEGPRKWLWASWTKGWRRGDLGRGLYPLPGCGSCGMDNNHFSSLEDKRAQASSTKLGNRPAAGRRTCQKCQSRQQHLIFTISAMGAISLSVPALENRKSEARNRCAQVRWGEYQRNCTCQLPKGHLFHPNTSKSANCSLSLYRGSPEKTF